MFLEAVLEVGKDVGGGRAIGELTQPVPLRPDEVKRGAVRHGVTIGRVGIVLACVMNTKIVRCGPRLLRIPGKPED